jgi:hypothetical protein
MRTSNTVVLLIVLCIALWYCKAQNCTAQFTCTACTTQPRNRTIFSFCQWCPFNQTCYDRIKYGLLCDNPISSPDVCVPKEITRKGSEYLVKVLLPTFGFITIVTSVLVYLFIRRKRNNRQFDQAQSTVNNITINQQNQSNNDHNNVKNVELEETPLPPVKNESQENECLICAANPKECAFVPCGHLCVCQKCASELIAISHKCPVCRADTTSTIKIFVP